MEEALRRALRLHKAEAGVNEEGPSTEGAADGTAGSSSFRRVLSVASFEEVLPSGATQAQPQYWHTLARALEERGGAEVTKKKVLTQLLPLC